MDRTLQDWEKEIESRPNDKILRLIFADWLKEQGDEKYEKAMRNLSQHWFTWGISLNRESSLRDYLIKQYNLQVKMQKMVENIANISLPITTPPLDWDAPLKVMSFFDLAPKIPKSGFIFGAIDEVNECPKPESNQKQKKDGDGLENTKEYTKSPPSEE